MATEREPESYAFTRDELRAKLTEALKAEPVTGTLLMFEQQGGGPGDLADAIIEALGGSDG